MAGPGLPRLYAIGDRETLDRHGVGVGAFARELRAAGVTLVQYRDKASAPQEVLRAARILAEVFAGSGATLVMNDRADLAALLGWGVHVGQGDLAVEDARRVVQGGVVVGVSTHDGEQILRLQPRLRTGLDGEPVSAPDESRRDPSYIAIGPVFRTSTKGDAAPVVGLEGVRRARSLTTKPLVAIGGITLEACRSVVEAGADSVAVISGLFVPGRSVRAVAEDFLERMR